MKQLQFLKLLTISAFITFGMVMVFMLLNTTLTGTVWAGMKLSRSALTGEYCEFNNVDKFFHQVMNTYTNLAYFFFGVLVLQIGINDLKNKALISMNRLEKFPALSMLMGICLIYLSFGSAFFHASLTYLSQRVDMNGTYSISIVLLGIALHHLFHPKFNENLKKAWIFFLIFVIVCFVQVHLMIPSGKLLPALILIQTVLVLIIYFQNRKEKSFILATSSLFLMIIAVKIRELDVQKVGCDPYSLYQGHSLWHLLTALSSFCGYAFFRFSKPV